VPHLLLSAYDVYNSIIKQGRQNMSTNNNNATTIGVFSGTQTGLVYNSNQASLRPSYPSVGTIYINNGNQEIWDGISWIPLAPLASPTYTMGSNFNSTQVATTQYVNSSMSGQVTLKGKNGKSVSVDEVIDFMEVMKKRMLILTPMFEKHEQYPALLQAYENYLMIERLCCGDDLDEE
jgi:hypothetical protein